jgi:hypothetical protein
MNPEKWLKRKYPNSFKEIRQFLDDKQLIEFKKSKMKIGRLTNDIIKCQKYFNGSLIIFRKSNPINSYNYPMHYGIIKCQKGYTESGYHSIHIFDCDFIEIIS